MKTFNRTSLPDSIKYNGKVYGKYAVTKGPNSIRVLVLSRRLKGMTDLHGNPYKPSVHFLDPI